MKAKVKATGEIVEVCHTTAENFDYVDIEPSLVRGMWTRRIWKTEELITPEDKHWQNIRERAAIAAMQGTITILGSSDRYAFREVVIEGYSGNEKTYPKEIAEFAVACADALIEELKKK